ncbi:MAG: hypothetical protein Q9224_006505 [Gallowayella concinna]
MSPKPASLLGLPFELRSQIFEESLPDHETVNRRCDPGILSVNKQLYEEASKILYRCNFIIEVNCSLDRTGLGAYDPKWRGSRLTGRFPFHKAKQIILQVDAADGIRHNHTFNHMVYICGLLCSEKNTPQRLRVDLGTNPDFYNEDRGCTFLNHPTRGDFEAEYGFIWGSRFNDFDSHIAFLLQPLALLKQVTDCKIAFPNNDELNENFKGLFQLYEDSIVDQKRTSCEESRWIWLEYMSLLVKQEQEERRKQQMKLANHDSWIAYTYKEHNCKHPGFGKKYYRPNNKKVQCEGCDRWLAWLTKCWKCGMKACASCRADLKHMRPVIEEARKLREGEDLGSALLDFGSAVVPGW